MKRFDSIDIFRGFAVLNFLFFNFLLSFARSKEVPFLLLHNQGNVLLYGDFIAAFFAFLIGVGTSLSYEKRKDSEEFASLVWKYIKRFAGLLILGLLLDSIMGLTLQWGVLQTLGLTGLFIIVFLPFDNKLRIMAALVILSIYALVLYDPIFTELLKIRHGGPIGAVSYAAIAIFGLVAGNWLAREKEARIIQNSIYFGAGLIVVAMFVSTVISFNKLLVTPSYSLVASGVSMLLLAILYYMVEIKKTRIEILKKFGLNSLFAWVAQYVLVFYPLTLFNSYFNMDFSISLASSLFFSIVIYLAIAEVEKRGIRFSF